MVAKSRTVNSAKLAIGTLAALPTAPKILVSAWSLMMEPGILTAVVPKNLGHVSDFFISDAIVEMALAARSDHGQREYNSMKYAGGSMDWTRGERGG